MIPRIQINIPPFGSKSVNPSVKLPVAHKNTSRVITRLVSKCRTNYPLDNREGSVFKLKHITDVNRFGNVY